MKNISELDLLKPPVNGLHLVESGAGTGKTYSIAVLFCWYVAAFLENVDSVLVVTFTEAATVELRERIHFFLKECLKLLSDDSYVSDNEHLTYICRTHIPKEMQKIHRLHLLASLKNFDEVSVYTIHAFCRRVLSQNAFETASVFGTNFIENEDDAIARISADCWKEELYGAGPLLYGEIRRLAQSPEELSSLFSVIRKRPDALLLPEAEKKEAVRHLQEECSVVESVFFELKNEWEISRDDILAQLGTMEQFSGNHFKGSIFVSRDKNFYARYFDFFLQSEVSGALSHPLFLALISKFSADMLKTKGMLKTFKDQAPDHRFFVLCEKLSAAQSLLTKKAEELLPYLQAEFYRRIDKSLQKYKSERHLLSYSDLLSGVDTALVSNGGEKLKTSVGQLFKAVLIDEFQDTDPLQYRIFSTLFADKNHSLYLIGDPKQAIYSFRGADIFTYMTAAKQCESSFILSKNRRSHPGICDAVNRLFSGYLPFVIPGIEYTKAEATQKGYISLQKKRMRPFICNTLSSSDPFSVEEARTLFARMCREKISQLLTDAAAGAVHTVDSDGNKRLITPSDIAVLVRSGYEGSLISAELKRAGISAVEVLPVSLFKTYEFEEMRILIRALGRSHDRSAVHALLASRLCGYTLYELDQLSCSNSGEYELLLERIHSYSVQMRHGSFYGVFMKLLADFDSIARVISLMGGERIYTNYMHIAESLHAEITRRNPGLEALLSWMDSLAASGESEQQAVRIESDDKAVKIMTIHKSKGLEFPIVFCPFIFHSSEVKVQRDGLIFYHDDDSIICDLQAKAGSSVHEKSCNEQLSENLRLLYVALTRARFNCTIFWGNIKNSATSAFSWLLHGNEGIDASPYSWLKKCSSEIESSDVLASLSSVFQGADCEIKEYEEQNGELSFPELSGKKLESRNFKTSVNRSFRITSYSYLVAGSDSNSKSDPADPGKTEFEDTGEILPPGARSGLVFHEIFEQISFGDTIEAVSETVVSVLRRYNLGEEFADSTTASIWNTLHASLPELNASFSDVSNTSISKEMEFYLHTPDFVPRALQKCIGAYYPRYIGSSFLNSPASLNGFLKGYIDCVFHHEGRYYIADWKSNYLGATPEDYSQESLERSMTEHGYHIQYLLYTVALRQFLKNSIADYSDAMLGGVYYLFIRGTNEGSSEGIYFDRPDVQCIQNLDNILSGAGVNS